MERQTPRQRISLGLNQNENNCYLFLIPIEILKYILNYLNIYEISKLDKATTNKRDREVYLKGIEGLEVRPNFCLCPQKCYSENQWILSRKVHLIQVLIFFQCPTYIELIERNKQSLNYISIHTPLEYSYNDVLFGAIGNCPNLISLDFLHQFPMSDSDLYGRLKYVKHLKSLDISHALKLSSRAIQSIPRYCPKLEYLSLTFAATLGDDDLQVLVNKLPCLKKLEICDAAITDHSILLLIEANREKNLITWELCDNVTWEGKYLYLTELHLPQLLSDDPKEQILGAQGFYFMMKEDEDIPIDEFLDMELFSRLEELITTSTDRKVIDECCSILFKIVEAAEISDLIDSEILYPIINFNFEILRESQFEYWLEVFSTISHDSDCCEYLIENRLISKIMAMPKEQLSKTDTVIEVLNHLSSHVANPLDDWLLTIPFLLERIEDQNYSNDEVILVHNKIAKQINAITNCHAIPLL